MSRMRVKSDDGEDPFIRATVRAMVSAVSRRRRMGNGYLCRSAYRRLRRL